MPLDYSGLIVGITLAGVIGAFMAIVLEANNRATKVEKESEELVANKQRWIDAEIMTSAKQILERRHFKIEELSRDDRRKFYAVVNTSANLRSMQNQVMIFRDRTTRAYVYGTVCAILMVLGGIAYTFLENPLSPGPSILISILIIAISLVAGFFYFRDGIVILLPLRTTEKAVARVKAASTIENLDQEVRAYLTRIPIAYLEVGYFVVAD